MKGVATGIVMGAAAAMVIEPTQRQKNKMKKNAEGVFRNIGSMIDTAVGMRK